MDSKPESPEPKHPLPTEEPDDGTEQPKQRMDKILIKLTILK